MKQVNVREATMEELGVLVDNELKLYNEALQKVRENLDITTREEVLELVDTLFNRKERYCNLRRKYIERVSNTREAEKVTK